MAGTAYPKRAIKQNRRTTRAKIGKPVACTNGER